MCNTNKNLLVAITNVGVSVFAVFPLTALWWAGSWKLCDIYLFPSRKLLSNSLSLYFGIFCVTIGYFILPYLRHVATPGFNVKHIVVSKIFVYIYSSGELSLWRGVWNLSDEFIPDTLEIAISTCCGSVILLVIFCGMSNCIGQPFFAIHDNRYDFYKTYPRFRTQLHTHPLCTHILDVLLTVAVIFPLSIQVWRSAWDIMDHTILPGDLYLSYIWCLGIGAVLTAIAYCMQHIMYKFGRYLHSWSTSQSLGVELLYKVYITIVVVLVWRGSWGLMKDYVLTPDKWDSWLCHVTGIGGLMLLQASSALGVAGCSVDGEIGEGQDFKFPISYVEHFMTRPEPTLRIQETGSIENSTAERQPLLAGDL